MALPILGGAEVALQREPALGQIAAQFARVDPEGPLLPELRERGEELIGSDEGAGPGENVAMHVGEEQQAAGRRARAPAEGGVDRRCAEVVGDAFPEEEATGGFAVAGLSHRRRKRSLVEVD